VADRIGLFKRVDVITDADEKTADKPNNYEEYIDELKSYNTKEVQRARVNSFTIDKYNELTRKHDRSRNLYFARLKKYFTLFYKDFQFNAPNDYRLIPPSTAAYKTIQIFILLPMFLLSFAGFLISIRKENFFMLFLSALFFSHLLLHVLVHYIDRYRVTILPVLLIISAYGITEIIQGLKKNPLILRILNKSY
jgi:hypothetical protein